MKPSQLLELSCQLHKKHVTPTISVNFRFNETISKFTIHAVFDVFAKGNKRINLVNIKMDGCRYLSSLNGKNLFHKLLKRLRSVSDLPNGCPIVAQQKYEIRNYTFLPDEYPSNAPESHWQMRVKLLKQNELYVDILFDGAVVYNT
ncbi:uncharacterized protein LOC115634383 [Scaptodrosophila lebanonensis]|uniref:Uncharacterized protein LOC115634383 n=1 Tax=Drosophila lebanonensis TaxID=7225 RepID=A0A6J2UKC2_DROLE|nr:uncharacterized protein LOC115634383 [Scaptodrosophila lebanonensis]